ncbi:Ger(x)C family spore germination protein [Pseudalkalibacillus salsuginis]|uniref:Ger(x)C family spore germination protein n=1 Tax=Pseudalkalibacillus salsuginis TaxID=2910972 RepID=UPI001F1B8A4F|nr:Ger(x)C family spore germination protein [Pseudalkalibacillus salsuginis]MCF6409809.1 Ger(x)C family spore germination protein [Pseudalkalibacillus salsuginis]
MKRAIHLFIIMFLLLNLLTGCWNRRELNELAITVGLAIDKSDDEFLVTAQVVNPGQVAAKQGGGQKTPVTTYQEKGSTVFEAIRRMTTRSPRKLFFPHLRIFVISEEIAEEGLGRTLDFISREHELRTDFYIIVAKDTRAENVLEVMTGLEDIPANKLFSSLEASERAWAPTMAVTVDELTTDIVTKGKHPHLTGIQVIGENRRIGGRLENVQEIEPDVKLKYSGMAVFKEDKLIGWLDEEGSKAVNYVQENVISTLGEVPCPEEKGKVAIEVIRTKADLKGRVEDGLPKGTVKIQVEGNVGDVQCKKLDLTKTKTIDDLEKRAEKKIEKLIESTITLAQEEFKLDFFGFGDAIHRSNPDYWKKAEKDWDEKFTDMPIEVEAVVEIRRLGTIGNSPLEKIKD